MPLEGGVDGRRFATVWVLATAVLLLVAVFGLNGLGDSGFWPRVNQHRLQIQAWLGEDIVTSREDGTGNGVVKVAPRLDVTPYIVYTFVLDDRELGMASNIAAVVPREPGGDGPPWRRAQTLDGDAGGNATATAFVGMPLGPALVILPFDFLMGGGGGVQWLGAMVGALAIAAIDALVPLWVALVAAGRSASRRAPRAAILLLAVAGTGLTIAAPDGGSPMFAHTAAAACLTLGLLAAVRGRALGAGLGWGLAIVCRPPTLLAAPLIVLLLLRGRDRDGGRVVALARLAVVPAVLGAAHAVLNQLRFGSPFDFGYAYMLTPPWLLERMLEVGQFSLAHLPRNLWYLFLQPPVAVLGPEGLRFPYLASDPMGMGLVFATPAFLAVLATVLAAVLRRAPMAPLVVACWLSLIAITIPALLYFNTGWVQWGGRFLLDGWPLWMLLTALGLGTLPKAVGRLLVALSIVSVGWGVVAMVTGVWPSCCM